MTRERYNTLAAVIASHPEGRVIGRTRLQKTIKLLQRLGAPLNYTYMIHFYGPYSEGLQSEINLLEQMGIIEETEQSSQEGHPYYILSVKEAQQSDLPNVKDFRAQIDLMANADSVVLELAATYDTFRESEMSHELAVQALRRKKGKKCDGGNQEKAFSLLESLGLPSN